MSKGFTEKDLEEWTRKGLVKEVRPHSVKLSEQVEEKLSSPKGTGGIREDLGHYCRSSWEANLARYYRFVGQPYFYEPCTFWFPIERGTRTYTPDFWLPDKDEWIEVKGYMDARSKTKLIRFQRYYPNERIIVVTETFFKKLRKQRMHKLIPNWE